ncbi:MAG: hypothetical protein II358_02030 [Tidjanibacter sp.]|nr:hypothetical protein [Tidjanibacter sp.]
MSKSNITFDVDRRSAKEGESITVTWDCGVPDSVSLRVDNGYRPFILQLADSGSRAIAIEKSKGKTTLRLTASCGTRKESREIVVKVKNTKVIKAKEVRYRRSRRNTSTTLPSFRELWQRLRSGLRSFVQRVEYAWRTMPPRTKRIYKFLLILLAAMWISSMGRSQGYKAGYEQGIKDRQSVEQRYHNGFEEPSTQTSTNGVI